MSSLVVYLKGSGDLQTKIQRWGNGLGLRIPKSFAAEARVDAGSTVDLSVEGGDLIVRPLSPRRYELAALLKGISASNVHKSVVWGEPASREAL